MQAFMDCDRGMSGIVWPDGGPLLDQPEKLVQAFGVISHAVTLARKRK